LRNGSYQTQKQAKNKRIQKARDPEKSQQGRRRQAMQEFFKSLGMDLSLATALQKQGIETLTEVQKKVIPEALKNRELVVQSETGSGKTLAFLLPLFMKINPEKKEMQALILAPTHELVMQILHQTELLAQNAGMKITSAPMIGNVNIERQIDKLKEKPHILVGTPGRILELIKKKKISAYTIKTIVLDEADTLTGEKNIESISAIIKSTLKERQLLMFSATITKQTETRAAELMREPERIRIEASAKIPDSILHFYFLTEERDKLEVLRKVIAIVKPEKALVFIGAREDADFCMTRLRYHGLLVESLHGHTEKKDRKRIMEDFRAGKTPVLIVSDIAARGLDIDGITHIFNLHIPEQPKDYLHRAGRTGRVGKKGTTISIVTERELTFISEYEKELKIHIDPKGMFKGKIVDANKNRHTS
jgi:superfamily II DNA/RNA helicase